MIIAYILLALAILSEVFGSTMLKLSHGFTRLLPIVGVVIGFGIAFYSLSIALKTLPLGVVYATWSGAGTILTVLIGVWLFKERLTRKSAVGIALLVVGIILLNLEK